MSLEVTYNGNQIAQLTQDGNLTLETAGKYCEGDIELAYSGGGGGVSDYHEITLTSDFPTAGGDQLYNFFRELIPNYTDYYAFAIKNYVSGLDYPVAALFQVWSKDSRLYTFGVVANASDQMQVSNMWNTVGKAGWTFVYWRFR